MPRAILIAVLTAAGCGRVAFDVADAAPVRLRIGERPGATNLGTADTALDSTMPSRARGSDPGISCDPPEFALLRFELPAGAGARPDVPAVRVG